MMERKLVANKEIKKKSNMVSDKMISLVWNVSK